MKNKETLEEIAERLYPTDCTNWSIKKPIKERKSFIEGVKWQQEKTIEEVFEWLTTNNYLTDLKETLIENFKNK